MANLSRTLGQCIGGVILLVALAGASIVAGMMIIVRTMGILGAIGELVAGAGLVVGIAGCLLYGLSRADRRGFALAPFVFLGLWLAISVGMRFWLSATTASLGPVAIDPELSKVRTFGVLGQWIRPTFLAEGLVDRVVVVDFEDSARKKIKTITELRLAKGDDCSSEDRERSGDLRQVGRIDECYKSTSLAEIPDGLYVEPYPKPNFTTTHCCLELSAVMMTGGQKRTVLTWRQGNARVPSYLPILAMFMGTSVETPASIWEDRSGPFTSVSFGAPDLRPATMASAIYGFDLTKPPSRSTASNAKLSQDALNLAETWERSNVRSALGIVAMLSQQGYIDDNMIKVATRRVYFTESGMRPDLQLYKFLPGLTAEQTAVFNDERLRILTTPRPCSWCAGFFGLGQSDITSQRASDAFRQRADLELWQYTGLLVWAEIWVHRADDAILQRHRSIFASVLQSTDEVKELKLRAFVQAAQRSLLDEEMRALTPLVDRFSETTVLRLAAFGLQSPAMWAKLDKLSTARGNGSILALCPRNDSWTVFWKAMLVRADLVADAEKRDRAKGEIAKFLSSNNLRHDEI